MFIKRTSKTVAGKQYVNHLLVESITTKAGPRHRTVCSLGSLSPAPREQWLALAHRIDSALGGQSGLFSDQPVAAAVDKVQSRSSVQTQPLQAAAPIGDLVSIHTDAVDFEEQREAGPVHVGHQLWQRLGLNGILNSAGLSARTCILTEVMTLNRLIKPLSEHAMPDWARRVAMADILGEDLDTLSDSALYRNLDRLHPQRQSIEAKLAEQERTLFNLEESIYLYDLTSTYFEGECMANPQAKRGYSRDKRPDCKQVVVGLVLDRDGFPKAHEVFDGNRQDRTTVEDMLKALEARAGKKLNATVVVDRGMAYDDNLKQINDRGYHYIVAGLQGTRNEHLDEFEDEAGWDEVVREPSPTNPGQRKSKVLIKRSAGAQEVHVLCKSDGRKEKDRAIREKHEQRLIEDLKKLAARVAEGQLADECKIHEGIGRLKERYPRVARYYSISYDPRPRKLAWELNVEKRTKAERMDGSYILKTDRQDLSVDEIWKTYILLTRVENAFRAMKSPLLERPIFHHLKNRVQTHIFLCILAYHLLVAIEKMFLDRGIHTSWDTLRSQLTTHQVVTVILPASNGDVLKIRKAGRADPIHKQIYQTLGVPEQVMTPIRTWCQNSH
jgi:transposase